MRASKRLVVSTVAALATLIVAVALLRSMPALLETPAIFASLLFMPLLVYVVASGAVTEITGPGGWAARFRDAARDPVSLDADVVPVNIVPKQDLMALDARMRTLDANSALAVTLQVDADGPNPNHFYDPMDLAHYLRTLLKADPDLTVIYVDEGGRFLASSDALSVIQIEDADNHLHRYVDHVNDYDPTEIRRIVPLTTKSLREDRSNADALRAMNADNVRSIIVVDEFRKPVGVVRRDTVIARLMESLVA